MQRGFDDQRAGALDPLLGVDDGPQGREYREGSRIFRREAFDAELDAATPPPVAPSSSSSPSSPPPGVGIESPEETDLPSVLVVDPPSPKKPKKPKAPSTPPLEQLSFL